MAAKKLRSIPMNLQLFASPFDNPEFAAKAAEFVNSIDGQGQGAAALEGQPQNVPQEPSSPQNSPQNLENSGQPSGEQQQPNMQPMDNGQLAQQQAQNPQEQMLLGKFKSPEELANGYVNVEKAFSQKSQEAAQARQENEQLRAMIEQMQQQFANSNVTQQPQEPQEPEVNGEDLLNKMYENPKAFFEQLQQQALEKAKQELMPQIQPIQQQFQAQQRQNMWNQAEQQFNSQVPDASQFKPLMDQVLQENPELYSHPKGPEAALQIAYKMAKGNSYQEPQAIFQNQEFVLQNLPQEVKQKLINDYLQETKQANSAPTIIGSQVGGNMMMTPENRPKSIDEANAMVLKMMEGQTSQ